MCILCREHETDLRRELCPLCEATVRLEVADGLYRLGRYLAAWAAFQAWERRQVPTT
jgi:hypothetical protein